VAGRNGSRGTNKQLAALNRIGNVINTYHGGALL
jgi:hypothetical protein